MSLIGTLVRLAKGEFPVVACEKCGKEMVNLHADEIGQGDLVTLRNQKLLIGNPGTTEAICIHCDADRPSLTQHLQSWFEPTPEKSDDDDEPSSSSHSDDSGFFGGSGFGGFGGSSGGFGGFGGGSFSGGGASVGF